MNATVLCVGRLKEPWPARGRGGVSKTPLPLRQVCHRAGGRRPGQPRGAGAGEGGRGAFEAHTPRRPRRRPLRGGRSPRIHQAWPNACAAGVPWVPARCWPSAVPTACQTPYSPVPTKSSLFPASPSPRADAGDPAGAALPRRAHTGRGAVSQVGAGCLPCVPAPGDLFGVPRRGSSGGPDGGCQESPEGKPVGKPWQPVPGAPPAANSR